jgi:hypothetical protein
VSVNPFESGVAVAVPVPPLWQRVLEALGPAFVEASGPLLAPMLQALLAPLDDVDDLVTDPRGYASLFNLDDSPVPGWLGQWVGVAYDPALTRAQQIAAVRSRGQTRGTPAALLAAARATLTSSDGMDPVIDLIERDGSAYRVRVRTYAAETPDPAATLRALRAAKPAGLVLTHQVLAGQDFHEVAEYGASFGMLRDSGLTFEQLLRRLPDNRDERTFSAAKGVGTFYDASRNTFARFLRPHLGRDRPTTVRTFGRLSTRSYGALRGSTYQQLPTEGA